MIFSTTGTLVNLNINRARSLVSLELLIVHIRIGKIPSSDFGQRFSGVDSLSFLVVNHWLLGVYEVETCSVPYSEYLNFLLFDEILRIVVTECHLVQLEFLILVLQILVEIVHIAIVLFQTISRCCNLILDSHKSSELSQISHHDALSF